jgi:transposase
VRGTTPLLRLLAQVLPAVDVPVVAAGGIGTGAALAAVLNAGAAGARVGTRFLASDESGAHPEYVAALLAASAEDTVRTTAFAEGWPDAPHRVLRAATEHASRANNVGFPSQRGEILLRERSSPMGETRRKFDKDFREGAVRLVRETGKPIAQVARDLGINSGTLGNWVDADRRRRGEGDGALSEDERAELARLRKENAELAMRCDVLKRSVALWVSDAMGR